MDKRQFLKTSGAFLTSTLFSPFGTESSAEAAPRTNWAGNLTYHTDKLLTPKTVAETQQLVKTTPKLRALGSRHSFNAIADSTARAGVRYGTPAPFIDQQGYALQDAMQYDSVYARARRFRLLESDFGSAAPEATQILASA